jgi:hypothetical protein
MVAMVGDGAAMYDLLLEAWDAFFARRWEGRWLLGRRNGSSSVKVLTLTREVGNNGVSIDECEDCGDNVRSGSTELARCDVEPSWLLVGAIVSVLSRCWGGAGLSSLDRVWRGGSCVVLSWDDDSKFA